MNYLLENYYKTCKSLTEQYGFIKKGQAFVRVVNDVMQNFLIERMRSGKSCRVVFSVLPFCMRIEKEYICGGVEAQSLRMFEPYQWYEADEWHYDPKSTQSMDACITEISRFIASYLLPFFECANSSKTALSAWFELDKHFQHTRQICLQLGGIEDAAAPILDPLSYCRNRYFLALKNGKYALALKSLRILLETCKKNYYYMVDIGISDEDRERREASIAELTSEAEHLQAYDVAYFEKLLSENEKYSKIILQKLIK